jgi:hypothetical protein
MTTHLTSNFPEKVLRFCGASKANPLANMSADALRDRIRAGHDSRAHFDELFRMNRARHLNSVPNPFLSAERHLP